MRKWMIAGAVVIVLAGGGYLGAQAYSSQRFDSEMDKLVARLDARPDWNVSREDVDSGWFHSSGRIEARHVAVARDADAVSIEIPYRANHGLLETTLDGETQVTDGDGRLLFGDVLESQGPMAWSGRFLTREQKLEGHFTLPSFSQTVTVPAREVAGEVTPARDMQLESAESTLDLEQVDDRVTLKGAVPRLRLTDDQADVLIEGATVSGTFEGDDQAFRQQMALTFPTTTVTPSGSPSVITRDIGYTVKAALDADQLTMQLKADLGDTRIQDQSVFSGGFTLALDRVDGDAYRALTKALEENLTEIQAAADADDDRALESALAPLQPSIQALLAGSPRLSLESLNADSPMLGMKMRGEGELSLDGAGIEDWDPETMSDAALESEFVRRLQGRLTLEGAPAVLLMTLGLPLGSDPLQVELADGILDIDGQRIPLLPPANDAN